MAKLIESSVVALGQFNSGILTPDWLVDQRILKGPATDAKFEIQIGQSPIPFKYALDHIIWIVLPTRLQVLCDVSLPLRAAEVMMGMFRVLEHTPVSAVGFNFVYKVALNSIHAEVADRLGRSISAALPVELETAKVESFRTVLTEDVYTGDRTQLDITVDDAEHIKVVVNFHSNVKNTNHLMDQLDLADANFKSAVEIVQALEV